MAQLLRSTVRLAVNVGCVDKAGRVVEILIAKYRMPLPAANFLRLPDILDVLCYVLLRSDEALQSVQLRVEEKLRLEATMREYLSRGRSPVNEHEEIS